MKNDFDHSTHNQSNDFYAFFNQALKGIDELFELVKDDDKLLKALSNTPPWSHYYELPFAITLATTILFFDLTEKFHSIANSPDSIQEIINICIDSPDTSKTDKVII